MGGRGSEGLSPLRSTHGAPSCGCSTRCPPPRDSPGERTPTAGQEANPPLPPPSPRESQGSGEPWHHHVTLCDPVLRLGCPAPSSCSRMGINQCETIPWLRLCLCPDPNHLFLPGGESSIS